MSGLTDRANRGQLVQSFAGWLPAIIFPTATLLQLVPVLRGETAGVSSISWAMFGLANLGAYIFSTQKQMPQIILSFLLTAVMDALIVVRCLLPT
jgi:hypothetical protein